MNLAPLILALANDWKVPDPLLSGFERYMTLIEALKPLHQSINIEPLPPPDIEEYPVGLFLIPPDEREYIQNELQSDLLPERPVDFIRAWHVEGHENVLLFPDDGLQEPNISLFAPTPTSDNDLQLHTLKGRIGHKRNSILDACVRRNGCTTKAVWQGRNRYIDCDRTGCSNPCEGPFNDREHERVSVWYCRC